MNRLLTVLNWIFHPFHNYERWVSDRWVRECEANNLRLHREAVNASRHLLTSTNWRDSTGKEEFVNGVFGVIRPTYLWYAVGTYEAPPSNDDYADLTQSIWLGKKPYMRDYIPVESGCPQVGHCVRIRNPRRVLAEISLFGRACPLIQIGDPDEEDGGPIVSFPALVKEVPTLRLGLA